MAELRVRVCGVEFRVFDHGLHGLVGAVGGGVVYVDGFEFDVERGFVGGIEADDVLADLVDLGLLRDFFVLSVADLLVGANLAALFSHGQLAIEGILEEEGVLDLIFELV